MGRRRPLYTISDDQLAKMAEGFEGAYITGFASELSTSKNAVGSFWKAILDKSIAMQEPLERYVELHKDTWLKLLFLMKSEGRASIPTQIFIMIDRAYAEALTGYARERERRLTLADKKAYAPSPSEVPKSAKPPSKYDQLDILPGLE